MANLKMIHLAIFISLLSSTLVKSEGLVPNNPRKLDETNPDVENKCGGCPCNNPCVPPSPPPPPPPTPCPPPPAPKKPPPSNNCPPPPASNCPNGGCSQFPPNPPYIFINGPPGNLYPVDAYYSGSSRSSSTGVFQFLIISCVGLLILW